MPIAGKSKGYVKATVHGVARGTADPRLPAPGQSLAEVRKGMRKQGDTALLDEALGDVDLPAPVQGADAPDGVFMRRPTT